MSTQPASGERPALRAIGYVRVSMLHEEQVSPAQQRHAIEAHCDRHGYTLSEVYEDLNRTGRNFARAEVRRAIDAVKAKTADVVVIWKLSRFGRNRKDYYVHLEEVEVAGGRLESATEDFDPATSTGRLTRGMLIELAAWESDRTGEVWRETHERRIRAGLPHTGQARYGYDRTGTQVSTARGVRLVDERYEVNPEQAKVVRWAYTEYLADRGLMPLVRELNRRGVPNGAGRPWSPMTLAAVLDSGFAAGLIYHGVGTIHRADRTYRPGAHEPIIDTATWEAYVAARRARKGTASRVVEPRYPLAGLIRCGDCGSAMHSARGGTGQGRVYQCGRWRRCRDVRCVTVSRARAETEVRAWLAQHAADIEAAAAADDAAARRVLRVVTDLDRARAALADVDAQLTELTRHLVSGRIREADYDRVRDELLGQRALVAEQLAAAEHEQRRQPPAGTGRVAASLAQEWDLLPARAVRDLLSTLLVRVEVHPPERRGGCSRVVCVPVWGDQTSGDLSRRPSEMEQEVQDCEDDAREDGDDDGSFDAHD